MLLALSAMLLTWLFTWDWLPAIIALLIARHILKLVTERALQIGQDLEEILADLAIGITVSIGQKFQNLCWMASRFATGHIIMLLFQRS